MRRGLFLGYVDNKRAEGVKARDFDTPARLRLSRVVRARSAVRILG
jgi:hypothetical protein